jgi:nitronate monooxygenase
VQDHRLAVAVSISGGLGSIPMGMLDVDGMQRELNAYRSLTRQPVNVNFYCHDMPRQDEAQQLRWIKKLSPFCTALGIEQPHAKPALRLPFDARCMPVLAAFLPEVVSFHFGLPADEHIRSIKALGLKVISSATTLEEALYLQEKGVDAVIAQGLEAGGHRAMFLSDDLNTQLPMRILVKQLVSRLRVPVIAAGGLADASDWSMAFAAGAQAVQLGSAFLLTHEATTSAVHRQVIENAQKSIYYESHEHPYTAVTNVFSGRPARGLMNRLMRELGPMHTEVPSFPYAAAASAGLRAAAEDQACSDFTPLWMGQNLSAAQSESAEALIQRFLVWSVNHFENQNKG